MSISIFHISDTHGLHSKIELDYSPDIIVHSGDFTNKLDDKSKGYCSFVEWFSELPIRHKILIAGNHDTYMRDFEGYLVNELYEMGIMYLNKSMVSILGLNIYGDPTTPKFRNGAFTDSRRNMYKHWEMIPEDTDVLITHCPPYGILDVSRDIRDGKELSVGCSSLADRVRELPNLKAHLFGHIHNSTVEGRYVKNNGTKIVGDTIYSNGSIVIDDKESHVLLEEGNKIELRK